jgi:hypothetical protein
MTATKLGNLFFMPNTYYHPACLPLNPEQWAATLIRKQQQDAAEAALAAAKRAPHIPSLSEI